MTFSDFNFDPDLMEGLEALNFITPTPIQAQAIPLILQGKDLVGVAQTGTGKTAAFVLPILEKILTSGYSDETQALIIVPTRELAGQIEKVIEAYSYFTGVSCLAIYGGGKGNDFAQEKTAITGGVDVIIATPGRLIAHMNLGYVDFSRLRFLVLDEADRMLDMGFLPDLMSIINKVNPGRQSLLFSATMPPLVLKLAKTLLRDPEMVTIALSRPAEGVTQRVYLVGDSQKIPLLIHLLKDRSGQRIVVFASTKLAVSSVYRQLTGRKLPVAMISSDLEQAEREQVMLDFRNRKTDVLIATDVLSRGIDIDGIDMVINYDVPRDAEDYVHRIGRTARAERLGTALTFISNFDLIRFKKIEKLIGKSIERLPLPFPEKEPLPSTSPSQGQRNRGEGNRPPQKKGQWRHKKRKSKTGGSAPAP